MGPKKAIFGPIIYKNFKYNLFSLIYTNQRLVDFLIEELRGNISFFVISSIFLLARELKAIIIPYLA
jgi:hypothetical protein